MDLNKIAKRILVIVMAVMMVTSMGTPPAFAVGETNAAGDQAGIEQQTPGTEDPQTQDGVSDANAGGDSEADAGSGTDEGDKTNNASDQTSDEAPEAAGGAANDPQAADPENAEEPAESRNMLKSSGAEASPGEYTLHFTPQGNKNEVFYDMTATVESAEGDILGTYDISANVPSTGNTRIFYAGYRKAPEYIEIKCMYSDGNGSEELTYKAPFEEFCHNEEATGISQDIDPGQEKIFCLYTIERAEDGASATYVDAQGRPHVQENVKTFKSDYIPSGWFILRDIRDLPNVRIGSSGPVDVNLILADGSHMNVEDGFFIERGSTLTIWGQENQTGTIETNGAYVYQDTYTTTTGEHDYGSAGIEIENNAKLTINGGRIEARGGHGDYGNGTLTGSGDAGIGVYPNGELEINGGNVTAKGEASQKIKNIAINRGGGAGIGGGANSGANSGRITINGGTVNAKGAIGAAGIGGGVGGNSGAITITGGRIKAEGGSFGGAGIGGGLQGTNGEINISGGYIKAMHHQQKGAEERENNGTGIGAGAGRDQSGDITIGGYATVYADGCRGAGIGGGGHTGTDTGRGDGYGGKSITIGGHSTVFAVSDIGAGIGGGGAGAGSDAGNGGNITIDSGHVMAVSTKKGAGIGGGNDGPGGTITINGGEVVACGGNASRGVLDGFMDSWSDISDSDTPGSYQAGALLGLIIDQLITSGTWAGAGIGGGDQDVGGTVKINGGIVTAVGGINDKTKAIGHGNDKTENGSLTIYEHSKTTYGHLSDDGKIAEDGVVKGPAAGVEKAQSNTYAKIEPGEIEVSFDVQGHGTAPESQTVTYGKRAQRPADPEAEGYFFGGWYKEPECTNEFNFNDPILRDTTIYARWLTKRTLKIRKNWNGATDLPDSLKVLYTSDNVANKDIQEDTAYSEIVLDADHNWAGEIKVSDEAVITIREPEVEGFKTDGYVIGDNIALPKEDHWHTASLNLRDQESSGLSETDFNAVTAAVKNNEAVITINNIRQRVYSVKKVWELPQNQDNYVGNVYAALQHKENGEWKTVQTITLENSWKQKTTDGKFKPVPDDGKPAFEEYRIRELDKDGSVVLDSSDEGGSEDPSVTIHAQPSSDTELDMEYKVSYENDASEPETTITNKNEGNVYTVKVRWLDFNGQEDTEVPDSVRIELDEVVGYTDGKKELITIGSIPNLKLSSENGWQGSISGELEGKTCVARELNGENTGGGLVYDEGDALPPYGDQRAGKAVYIVTKDGKTRQYEYDVTYKVDGNVTTITNKRTGIIYSAKKEWDEKEDGNWSEKLVVVQAILQHREADGSWQDAGMADLNLYFGWKAEFPAVPINEDFNEDDYRIREFIEDEYNKDREDDHGMPNPSWTTITFFDPEEELSEHTYGSRILKGKVLLEKTDPDNTSGSAPVFKARHIIRHSEVEDEVYDTHFTATYKWDDTGTCVITNHQAGKLSVRKEWKSDRENAPVPESVKVALQEKSGDGNSASWTTKETATLNKDNKWEHSFAIEEGADESKFRIRELRADESAVLEENDSGYDSGKDPRAEFDVTENGKTEKISYKVSYKKEGPLTILTNTDDTKHISIEKKWDIDIEKKDKPGRIETAVQKKKDGKWETVKVVELNDENKWKAEVAIPKADDTEYRVRELRQETALEDLVKKIKEGTAGTYDEIINQIKESSYYNALPDNIKEAADTGKDKLKEVLEAGEDDLFDKLLEQLDLASAKDRIVHDEDDSDKGDGTTNEVVYHVDEYMSAVTGGQESAHNTTYRVSYAEKNGKYTITNKAILKIDVIKRWIALGVDEEDMPDSAWVVLMCKPKEGALENAKNLPGVGKITGVLDYEFPVMNPIEGGIDPFNLFSRLAIGLDISHITKVAKSVAKVFGIEWIIPEFAIGKVDKDCDWTYKVVDSKYTAGIPMEYKGAELSSELIRQIIKYITHGLIPDIPVSFNPFDGYISIPTKAIKTVLGIENWSDIIDGTAWDNLKDKGKNLTWDDIKDFGPKSLLDDDHMMANVINVKIDIDPDDPDDPGDPKSLKGSKKWVGDKEEDRPDTLTIHIKDGENEVKSVVLNKSDFTGKSVWNWTATIEDPDEDANYAVTEEFPADYAKKDNYSCVVDGLDIVNTWKDTVPPEDEKTVNISGRKVWKDDNDSLGYRPDKIKVYLLANGERAKDEDGNDVYAETSAAGDWKFFFSDMPEKNDAGDTIDYSVSEAAVGNYSVKISRTGNYFTITNTCTPPRIDIDVVKEWEDGDDRDGIRPDSVTVKLLADDEDTGKTLTLSEDNGWAGSFDDVPEFDKERSIIYTVEEVETDVLTGEDGPGTYDSEISGSAAKGFTITNTHTPETVDVSGSKTWDDDDDRDGYRPNNITIRLLANGSEVDSRTVTSGDDWKWTFEDMPKNDQGNEITYSITEDPVNKYRTEINGYDVTNTHEPERSPVSVIKNWKDNRNQDGNRPGSIRFHLLADGVEIRSMSLSVSHSSEQSSYRFPDNDDEHPLYVYRDHGVKIKYTVTEDPVEGYTSQAGGKTVVNTYNPGKTQVGVHKVWDDSNDQDGIRPDFVTVKLLAGGEDTGKTLTLSEGNDWAGSFDDLMKYRSGRIIAYSIIEEETEVLTGTDGAGTYSNSVSGDADNGFTITNKHTPETIDIRVDKVWDDNDDQDGERPDSVTVRLRADGQEVASQELKPGLLGVGGWSHTFRDLPVYRDGQKIRYSISEDAVAGYVASFSGDADTGFTVTNKHAPGRIKFEVFQVWLDDSDRDGKRPKEQKVHLWANGEDTGKVITLTEAGGWQGSFGELDLYKDRKRVSYEVIPDDVEGYEATRMGDEENNFVLFNSRNPEKKTINVTKIWDEAGDATHRPNSITIRLRADGREIASKEVIEVNDEWKCSFDDVYAYENGRKISYTVSEDMVDEYTSSISGDADNGFTITNKRSPGMTQINVNKVWTDADDQDGIRPASVSVQLLKDGAPVSENNPLIINGQTVTSVDPLTLTEGNGWSGSFTGLPKYEDSDLIYYEVREVESGVITGTDEGYTPEISGDYISGYTITNIHAPETFEIPVDVTWDDENDADGVRPDIVALRMLANGEQYGMTYSTKEEDWAGDVFVKMPRFMNGEEIKWSMTATDPEGEAIPYYEVTISGSASEGFHALLKHVPVRYTITYKLNGGSYNGSTDDITETYRKGTVIDIHEAPVREGYEFTYWKGSEYQPGDKYTVAEDHVFTAQWKKAPEPGDPDDPDDPDKPGKGVKTGDENHIVLWLALAILSFAELIILLVRRKTGTS